jgi:hypothetical protein
MFAHDLFKGGFPVVAAEELDQASEITVKTHRNPQLNG